MGHDSVARRGRRPGDLGLSSVALPLRARSERLPLWPLCALSIYYARCHSGIRVGLTPLALILAGLIFVTTALNYAGRHCSSACGVGARKPRGAHSADRPDSWPVRLGTSSTTRRPFRFRRTSRSATSASSASTCALHPDSEDREPVACRRHSHPDRRPDRPERCGHPRVKASLNCPAFLRT